MGPVFRGEDGETRDPVVVKVIRVGLPPERVAIVGTALAALAERLPDHPTLTPIIDTGVVDVEPYVVSPFIEGDSLDVALREFGPAHLTDALPRLRRLADALDAAAAVGAAHGSLHLRDIVVSVEETVLTGVGMAAVLERVGVRPPVRRPYCAPEVALGNGISPAADQYALAAIAHEWLSGRRLSGGGAAGFQLPAVSEDGAAALQAVFARAMHESPDQRFPTSTAFIDAVAALAEHAPPRARSGRRAPAAEAPRLAFDDPAEAVDDMAPAYEPAAFTPVPSDPLDAFLDRSAGPAAMTLAEDEDDDAEGMRLAPAFSTLDDESDDDRVADDDADPSDGADEADAEDEIAAVDDVADEDDTAPVPPVIAHDDWVVDAGHHAARSGDLTFGDEPDDEAPGGLVPPVADAEPAGDSRRSWAGWALLLALLSVGAVGGGWLLLRWGTPATRTAARTETASPPASTGPDAPAPAATPSRDTAPAAPPATPRATPPAPTPAPQQATPPAATPPAAAPPPPRATSPAARPPAAAPAPTAAPRAPSVPPPATSAARTPAPPAAAPAESANLPGRVLVRTTPAGAEVFVNGERRGVTPLALRDLSFGTYTVRVARAGYEPVEQRVAIDSGRPARSLEIALPRAGATPAAPVAAPGGGSQAPAAAPGSLLVESRPAGARVWVDGAEVGVTPVTVARLASGAHSVRIERPGYRPITTTTRVEAGERTRVAVTLTAERPR